MTDEIIKQLWRIKDDIAREHSDDLDRLVADLKSKDHTEKTKWLLIEAVQAHTEVDQRIIK